MNSEPDVAMLTPFQLEPKFVERIWGTPDLRPWYDFDAGQEAGHDPIGEVWLTGDQCKVLTGVLAGKTLGEVFAQYALAMLGKLAAERMRGESPLLLKVIFAREKLSVQVHPDDRLAQKYGQPRGKTECWYALAAEPGAEVAAGLRPGVTLDQVERGVADGTLEDSLEILPVVAGDMVYVDAGTVHAIWPGSVLLETQQNCDITYRLYDYGRPRELHVARALEAIRLKTDAGKIAPVKHADRTVLVDRKYFCVEKITVEGARTGASMVGADEFTGEGDSGLAYLFAAAGSGQITALDPAGFEPIPLLSRGVAAIPAASSQWRIEDCGGLDLIRITPRFPAGGPA
jgi:mannose-6-phosphate isomerase